METALRSTWRPAAPPRRPVLLINPRSGGGRATRAALAEHAREQGIEAVVLEPGQDLATVVREAVASGADALGMAGGDGSLAVVAAAACRHGLPFVCVPAGTRNHFAQDLGIDRRDVTGALRAFTDGVERRIDVGLVNGRLFLNNVSLGLYGDAVQQAAYREAKLRTLLATANAVVSSKAPAPSMQVVDDRGEAHSHPAVVLVSNNPYALERPPVAGTRPRLDSARLGSSCSMRRGAVGTPRRGRGARRRSRCARRRRCMPASTARPWIWIRSCGSRSGRRPCACGSRRAIRASRRPEGCRPAALTCASRSRRRTPRLARRRPVRWAGRARGQRAGWTVERLAPTIPVAESAVRGLVPRGPLFDRLSAAGPGEVVLVCAPAGSGKTVLLRSWVESTGVADRVAWISVERGERDAQGFWLSVIDALAGADGSVERVAATPAFGGEAVVERLLSDLWSLDRPVVLLIDDLHELRSTEALRLLELFLAELPPQLRVVLATREDPGLGLHRMRLAGALIEIRASDLRFSLEGTRELLDASGVVLSGRGLELLHQRTEGWAAGLRLAAISLARHPDPERCVTEFSGSERTVAGYLLAEVLERQPPEVRDLLLRTSVLERVSGSLGDALTGGAGSEAILQGLEDANAFVTSIDLGRTWFRYHHLFADLLQLELRRTSPALIDSLHRAAAQWFSEHGYVVEAIGHAQAARDWDHAARLLADNYVDLVFDGRKATLRALLAAFPADAPEGDAELALACATARLYDGLLDDSAAYLAAAERSAATVPDDRRRLLDLRLGSARLWLACQRGDLRTARQAMQALQAHSADTQARRVDHVASALLNLGIAELWSLHMDDARRHLEEALALARRNGRPYLEIGCLGHLALAADLSGSPVPVGLRLSEEAVTIAEEHGWGTHRILAPAVAAGAAALAWLGRLDEAERWLERVERAQPSAGEIETEPLLHWARAFVRIGQGRFEEALAEFRAAETVLPALAREHLLPVELRAWIAQTQVLTGDTAAARATLAALDAEERDGAGMRLAAAAVALGEGVPEEAVDVLAPMCTNAPDPPADGSPSVLNLRRATAHAFLLDAVARDALGDQRAAEASVERALALAEHDGMILQFLMTPVRGLLERHPKHRTAHAALLTTILDLLAGTPPQQPRATMPLRDELSDAELRVMRYLPSNLKATEIAGELFVSANTVRTHLRHIYAKLDAHSRSEAVTRARELGLLAPGGRVR